MFNAKIILMASTLTIALAAAFIYMGVVLLGNENYSSFYLEGTDAHQNTLYLTVNKNVVTYDFAVPVSIDNSPYTHLYRLTTDNNSPFYNRFIHTLVPEGKESTLNVWDCEASVPINGEVVTETEFTVDILDSTITINYRGENATITLDKDRKPITFGAFNVTKFYFNPSTSNEAPTSYIKVDRTSCVSNQVENYSNYTGYDNTSNAGKHLRRELNTPSFATITPNQEICALWIAKLSYELPGTQPLIDVGSCGRDSDNEPISIIAFQGTQFDTSETVYADLKSLGDNWDLAYSYVAPYLTDSYLASYGVKARKSNKKFSVCTGHSLGAATAIKADSVMSNLCERIIGYGSPIVDSESTTPLTIYMNTAPISICVKRYTWFPFVCKTSRTGFIRDLVTYVGFLAGRQRNARYIYNLNKNQINNFDSSLDGGLITSLLNDGLSLHSMADQYYANWCQRNLDAKSDKKNCKD